MKKLRSAITAFILVLVLAGISRAGATELRSRVKSAIDSALVILNDPALTGKAHVVERRAKVRALLDDAIDFEEMTKRSLGIHWKKRTEKEKTEFVALFSALLENAYIDRIEANYDAKVLYSGEKINKKGTRGIVKTIVVTRKGTDVPIDYRMIKKEQGWVAYDIVIEGVSLVSNYRTQFNQIIHKSSYDNLVKGLRKKMESRKPLILKHPLK